MTGPGVAPIADEHSPSADAGEHDNVRRALSTRGGTALLAIAAAVVGLEALAYLVHGPFEWTAARLWALGGCGFVGLGVVAIARAVAGSVRDRCLTSLIMVLALGFVALWGISGVDHVQIQHEATQQIADGLEASQQPGWGYTGIGFLGYPTRQYQVTAVPSLLLGRGLPALRLGFALPFLFGALLFWAGAREWWRGLPGGGAAAALAALSVPAFPYAIDHLRLYEQSVFPLAATLAAAGWLLIAERRPTVPALLGLGWIGALLGCSYTPGLASAGLLAAAVLWLAALSWRRAERGPALGWLATAATIVGITALSFLTRLDLLKGAGDTVRADLAGSLREAFAIFLFGTPKLFVPPALFLPIMAVIVLGLVGRLRLHGVAIAWWTLAVIAIAVCLRGYADPPPNMAIHRALVVIPPLLLLAGWTSLGFLANRSAPCAARAVLATVTVLMLGQVAWNLAALDREYRPTLHEVVLADMLEQSRRLGMASDAMPTVVLLTGREDIANARDYLLYFYPGHRIVRSVEEAATLDPAAGPVLVYADADTWSEGSLPWLSGLDRALIEYRHPHFPHRMLRWASNPGVRDSGTPPAVGH